MKYTLTPSILIVIDNNGKSYRIEKTHKFFNEICQAVSKNDQDAFENALNRLTKLEDWEHPLFEKRDEGVYFRGRWKLPKPTVDKARSILEHGMSIDPLIAFLDNLFNNVSFRVVQQLISFLDYDELPITEDGCFIAYKGLSHDKYSIHGNKDVFPTLGVRDERGRILNEVGHIIEVPRNMVDDNPNNTCSVGLHVGSYDYAKDFAEGILACVKVNPIDVVSVPTDYDGQKLRCCRYEILSHEVCEKIETPVYGWDVADTTDAERQLLNSVDDLPSGSYGIPVLAKESGISEFQVEQILLSNFVDGQRYGYFYCPTNKTLSIGGEDLL